MKRKFFLLAALTMLLAACNTNEPGSNQKADSTFKYKVLFSGDSPYLDWYFGNMESFISYSYLDYPSDTKGQQHEHTRGIEDNTITLKDDLQIRIHVEYEMKNEGEITTLNLTRSGVILKNSESAPTRRNIVTDYATGATTQHYTYTIHSATPIYLYRPTVDDCDPIPFCYYDNFEIEWNGDETNTNGVVIIAEWNGVTISNPTEPISIANVDLVEDTGWATLNTDLFNDMPDEALVNLWLIRGNLITINETGDLSLSDILSSDIESVGEMLSSNPELLLQLQSFMFGSGAVTRFSFFLVRTL